MINFNIVLVEPEIPMNTGNIGRVCVGTESKLHLVKPLGFEINDTRLKRAGLDYWPQLQIEIHESLEAWQQKVADPSRVFYFTTKVKKTLFNHSFKQGDWLVFGKETKGLPESLIAENLEQCLTIPFTGPIRSFNLANSVSMSLLEGIRQLHHSN